MKTLMGVVLTVVVCSSRVFAQSHDTEFTPGPRMIHAIEQVAASFVHRGSHLGLTTEQKSAMADLVQRMKTDMWLKEAVLVGMFQELEEKRRHGLLRDDDYRVANTMTGGIETDELNLFIETLAALRGVLTADQKATLQAELHAPMVFRLTQGFNTKIGLMSLEGIGRVYNVYRDDLSLTQAQAEAIQSWLEEARREVLRLGTAIDLSRVESDELVMRLDVDPQTIRAKMQKTGETEGVLFNKLLEVTDRIQAQLTEEQRTKLAKLKQTRSHSHRSAGRQHPGHARNGHHHAAGFDYFLGHAERLRLTEDQIAALVAAKNETRKTVLLEQAKLKGAELKLLNLLRDRDGAAPAADKEITTAIRRLEEIRSRITQAKAAGYLTARQVLTPEQQQHVHPPQMLDDGREP